MLCEAIRGDKSWLLCEASGQLLCESERLDTWLPKSMLRPSECKFGAQSVCKAACRRLSNCRVQDKVVRL